MVQITKLVSALAGLASLGVAHPGHNVEVEAAERAAYLKSTSPQSRSLARCLPKMRKRGMEDFNIARRENAVRQLRQKRSLSTGASYLKARDMDSVLATDHHSNRTGLNPETDAAVLFASGGTCIVQPEVTQGPYYVGGEFVRKNVVESQRGIPLYMDIQLIDTNTCEPLPEIYTDIWHCNATVRCLLGVIANGNGNENDTSNEDTTFLRGVQPSDNEGVVQFETIFPGHYTGRAPHIHVVTHPKNETRVLANGTIAGLHGIYDTRASHVGQLFFDQDLITAVEKNRPYSTNTQSLTKNSDDSIMETEADTTDPVMEYVYLGDSASDGIFAWISIGINNKKDEYESAEGWLTEEGGVENENFSMDMAGMGSIGSMISTASSAASTA
ncbi:protocatechuate 3-4-dioxygenase beta subunit [Penicillium frequentans]|uniref:Protocatechuate 3-4-dioxygenase beta subunit n=1 Tax=Penicillium frequentans TaxID=3151616 RepID=A0AAD6GJ63_9EURO|nr:protocatechuate 3-4-dioxygenase beta subunit [Penicillium glabrum]